MSQFVPFEEAAESLGVETDQLNALREAGKIRAYRDGASWKMREDELDKLKADRSLLDPAATSDVGLVPDEEQGEGSDSILVSDAAAADDSGRPPSTIIGKPGESKGDSDLELSLESDEPAPGASDVQLAPQSQTSDVMSSSESGSHILGMPTPTPAPASKFEDLDELEIDLETESSKILSASEVGKLELETEGSELELVDSGVITPEEKQKETPKPADPPSGDDDDLVLGDGGSDITLSAGDSGINLVDPADSGLALDDISLELGGSGIEPLDLAGASDAGEEKLELEEAEPLEDIGEMQADDGFELTPLGDMPGEESDDSGSQVIALDSAASFEDGVGVLEDVGDAGEVTLQPVEAGDAEMGDGLGGMPATTGAATVPDTTFTGWNVAGLVVCVLTLSLGGMMMFDLMRNMWSWNEPYSITSSIMESLSFF